MKDMDSLVEKAADAVEAQCAPEKMTQTEARDFLEGVIARLEGSLDALKEEIGEE